MIWCMKSENKCKRKGIKVLPALGEKNLAKRMVENDKKNGLEPWPSRIERERKSWKTFEKVSLNTWKSVLKKFSTRFLIDRKTNSIGRKCFDWSNTNRAPIETNKDSRTFLIAILIGRKTISIGQNSGKISFLKNKA